MRCVPHAALVAAAAWAGAARANVPETIVPVFPEVGFGGYSGPSPAGEAGTGASTGTPGGTNGGTGTGTVAVGEGGQTAAMTNMLAQSYGQTAVATADRIGVSAETTAAIGQAESSWRNIRTENGTSNATGPWQIVPGTFTATSTRYGLGYTAADINNPEAQAVVANYYIRETAQAVSAATGQPATTLQTWNGYVFGPTKGAQIAVSPNETPLRDIVPARSIANNELPADITVGQLNARYADRLGPAAYQPALTSRVGS